MFGQVVAVTTSTFSVGLVQRIGGAGVGGGGRSGGGAVGGWLGGGGGREVVHLRMPAMVIGIRLG